MRCTPLDGRVKPGHDVKFLAPFHGQVLDAPPVWLMPQAGRYLPEYRATRAEAGSFLKLCYSPKLAAEVTLQPIRRYGFDEGKMRRRQGQAHRTSPRARSRQHRVRQSQSNEGRDWRSFLTPPRLTLLSTRRALAARLGLVAMRRFGT